MAKARIPAIGTASRIQSITCIEQALRSRRAGGGVTPVGHSGVAALRIANLPQLPPDAGQPADYGPLRAVQRTGDCRFAGMYCKFQSQHDRRFFTLRKSEKSRRNSTTEIVGIPVGQQLLHTQSILPRLSVGAGSRASIGLNGFRERREHRFWKVSAPGRLA